MLKCVLWMELSRLSRTGKVLGWIVRCRRRRVSVYCFDLCDCEGNDEDSPLLCSLDQSCATSKKDKSAHPFVFRGASIVMRKQMADGGSQTHQEPKLTRGRGRSTTMKASKEGCPTLITKKRSAVQSEGCSSETSAR